MTTLIVLAGDELTTSELDKLFGDFLEAVAYEKKTGFVTRMAAVSTQGKGLSYVPAPEKETPAESSMRKSLEN